MATRKQEFHEDDQHITQTEKRSRITFDVSPEMKRRIKIAALQNDVSIGEYLGRILEQSVPDEMQMIQQKSRPITRESIERLQRLRAHILQDRDGKPFEDSTEMIRQMWEERAIHLEHL